jgi:hypothetical protein
MYVANVSMLYVCMWLCMYGWIALFSVHIENSGNFDMRGDVDQPPLAWPTLESTQTGTKKTLSISYPLSPLPDKLSRPPKPLEENSDNFDMRGTSINPLTPDQTLEALPRWPQTLEVLPRPPQPLEASRPLKFTKLKERCQGHRKP